MSGDRITRDDLEAKFRELDTETSSTVEQARSFLVVGAAVAAVGVLAVVYVFGRRRGRKKTTVVEIKRI